MKILTSINISLSFITTSTSTTTTANAFLLNNNKNSKGGLNNNRYSCSGASCRSAGFTHFDCPSHGHCHAPIPFLMRRRTALSLHNGSGGGGRGDDYSTAALRTMSAKYCGSYYTCHSNSGSRIGRIRSISHQFDSSIRRRRQGIIARQQQQQDELEDVMKTTKIGNVKTDLKQDKSTTDVDAEISSPSIKEKEGKQIMELSSSPSYSSSSSKNDKKTMANSNKSKKKLKKGTKSSSRQKKNVVIRKEEEEEEKQQQQHQQMTRDEVSNKNKVTEAVTTSAKDTTKNERPTAATKPRTTETQRKELKSVSARYVYDNDLYLTTDEEGRLTARPAGKDGGKVSLFSNSIPSDVDIGNGKKNTKKTNKNQESKCQLEEIKTDEKQGRDDDGEKIIKVEQSSNNKSKIKANTTQRGDENKKKKKDEMLNSVERKAKKDEQDKDPSVQLPSSERTPISLQTALSLNASSSSSSSAITSTKTKEKPGKTQSTTQPKTITIPGITLPIRKAKPLVEDVPKPVISGGFNVVLTHCTADFDSLASAVGLAKLWSTPHPSGAVVATELSSSSSSSQTKSEKAYESSSHLPTFVVLPRGAHPSVQRFLALHKHLFPIRSLRSLPNDLSKLNRLGLVDAQRRDRVGPAEVLIGNADRVTIIDHHIDGTSDIPEATDYVIDKVGSVSTMVAEQLRDEGFELTEAEATLLALGIHADTGSLCFDSTTTRDAEALAWVMKQGASQAAIAENAHASLSQEQQGVLTNALINTNSTVVHGVTVSTVLLSADGFINGLAAVTQDALELSSSDVFLLAVVYDPKSGGRGKGKKKNELGVRLQSKLFKADDEEKRLERRNKFVMEAEAWKGGERALKLRRLRAAFDKKDVDGSGYLEEDEILKALTKSGVITSTSAMKSLISQIDTDGDGKIDFDEFVAFSDKAEKIQEEQEKLTGRKAATMIVIGRVKAGVNMKHVNLNRLFQQFGGGGHAKAASCTVRLEDESNAGTILQGIVDELIETGLMQQATVGDFMTSPVLSAKPTMTEKQVEDLFVRYDVRALPVVDDKNDVVGLVTYKEVAAAKQRLWNKEQKRIRQEANRTASNNGKKKNSSTSGKTDGKAEERKLGSALKGWMKQHVKTVEASMTMAEVEHMLLENDVGCIPVVADGTTQLVGMVTRTDLLRQHRYYPSLHYNNKGFADSIAARKPIIELRKKLKQFDLEDE